MPNPKKLSTKTKHRMIAEYVKSLLRVGAVNCRKAAYGMAADKFRVTTRTVESAVKEFSEIFGELDLT